MNERIRELAEQVYGSAHYDDFKFAELIVRECVIAIKDSDEFSDDAVDFIDQEIKQHFGVEE